MHLPLAQVVYFPRLLGFILAVTVTVFSDPSGLFSNPYKTFLILFCLAYARVALFVQERWLSTHSMICGAMLVDAVLVGLLIVANKFYLPSALSFTSFLILSTAVIGGLRWVFAVVSMTGLIVMMGGLFAPLPDIDSIVAVDNLIALATLIFLGAVAWQVFDATRALEFARRSANTERQSLQHKADSLVRYVGSELIDSLVDQPCATRRTQISVCFTDLSGFTALMDTLPEHKVTAVLNQYLNAMASLVRKHGGTLDKFMGDGVMVFFGDPHTQGVRQDALACVQMAQAMQAKLDQLCGNWQREGLPRLNMRVGIHTGYCTVGSFGAKHRMSYTAIGGVVNIASRLEGAADAGTLLVSETTAKLVAGHFAFGACRTLTLKGIAKPIKCVEVIAGAELRSDKARIQLLR